MRVLALFLVACSPSSALVVDRVDPPSGPSTASTAVRIEGTRFHLPVVSDVDEDKTTVKEVRVEIGGVALDGISWKSEGLIEGTVRPGLPLGPQDVMVRLGEDEGILAGGFLVTDNTVLPDGGTACASFGAWGTPQPITELNTSGFDAMPRLSADERTIFFHSIRGGGMGDRDIWTATRAGNGVPFGPATNVTELNTSVADRDPSITGDARTIIFSSARPGQLDIYSATRASTTQPFSAPLPLANVSSTSTDYFAWMSADGLTMYVSSTRGGNADLYYATRTSVTVDFPTPQPRSDVNSLSGDYAPVLSADGRELYFMSDRGGDPDIWVATRPDASAPFNTATRIPQISLPTNEDLPASISADGQRLYFSSGVVSTSAAIYVATRPCN